MLPALRGASSRLADGPGGRPSAPRRPCHGPAEPATPSSSRNARPVTAEDSSTPDRVPIPSSVLGPRAIRTGRRMGRPVLPKRAGEETPAVDTGTAGASRGPWLPQSLGHLVFEGGGVAAFL